MGGGAPTRCRVYAAALALSVLAAVLGLEAVGQAVFRIKKGEGPHAFARRHFYGEAQLYMSDHPYLPYFPSPGTLGVVRFNSWGGRGPEPESPKRRIRVLCFGGSTTFDGVHADGDTWPGRLQALLGPGYEVLNAAQNGATTADTLVKFALLDSALQPDWVLAYEGINDLEPSYAPGFRPDYSHRRRHIGAHPYPLLRRLPRWLDHSSLVTAAKWRLIGPRGDLHDQYTRPFSRLDFPAGPRGLSTYRRNLLELNALAKLAGARLVLGTAQFYRPWAEKNFGKDFADGWERGLKEENDLVRSLPAVDRNIAFAEVAGSFKPTEREMTDFCHLTEEGNQRVAEAFHKAMAAGRPSRAGR